MHHELLQIHPSVQQALKNGRPVVALESTLLSLGLPWPLCVDLILEIQAVIEKAGAVPATIALHAGKIQVGLDENLMNMIAQNENTKIASRRDMAFILSQGITAVTTVAATLYCTELAGLPLMVTGSISGMEHQSADSFDVSADLIELATSKVTVVCSGVKSILDLPKTLEMLETWGIPVAGYGTDEFPAFYTHSSGIPLKHRVHTSEEVAQLMRCQKKLTGHHGLIIANPIPGYAETPRIPVLPALEKFITPIILQKITALTEAQSLFINAELIKNNAMLGAEITKAYFK